MNRRAVLAIAPIALLTPMSGYNEQRDPLLEQMLAGIRFDHRRLDYHITLDGPRPILLGETDSSTRTITIYVRNDQPLALLRKVLAFELGHAFDLERLDDRDHALWLRLRHAPPRTEWWPPDLSPEQHYGAGDFADVFSLWATGSSAYFRSAIRQAPDAHDLRTLTHRFGFTPKGRRP